MTIKLFILALMKLQTIWFWSHDMPDGTTFQDRAENHGLDNGSELLYKGESCDIRNIVDMWNESPEHKKALDRYDNNAVIIIEPYDNGCKAIMVKTLKGRN